MSGIVIVGAGQAGASLAQKLRTEGYEGAVTLVGAEPVPPYERPPLSKSYLLGEQARERLFLRPEAIYAEKDITLRLGNAVTSLDPAAREITLEGEALAYDQLALVTGASPIRLPDAIGGNLDGVVTVRTLADIDAMRDRFVSGAKVLVVGGGYIGLEAAAVAAKLGLQVTLVEKADRILGRVASIETANVIRDAHKAHGVDLREGTGLDRLLGDDAVSAAVLDDGSELSVDFVVVGIGVRPDIDLAKAAGIACDNGIAVDELGQTSVPGIWAAGDCASFPYDDERIRLESVQNAIDQAEAVAVNLLGANRAYKPYPWFWSDQYDLKLQIAGLNTGFDHVVTRQDGASVSHWYYRGEQFLAVDAINAPRDYMVGKRVLEMGLDAPADIVADAGADLKALIKK